MLDIVVQKHRDAEAARRFLRKLMCRSGRPRALVSDKIRSYDVALRNDCRSADHRSRKQLNNRIEAANRHTRRREKIMGRFMSAG